MQRRPEVAKKINVLKKNNLFSLPVGCSKAFEGPIGGQTSPFIEEPGPGRRLSRPQSTPVTGALIFHRGRSQSAFDRVSGLRSDLHPQGLSAPARQDQLPSWDVLGCLLLNPLHMPSLGLGNCPTCSSPGQHLSTVLHSSA